MSESLYCRLCHGISRRRLPRAAALLPLLSRAVTLCGVLLLTAVLPWLSGSDPALALLRARSGDQEATAETLHAIRQSLGLEQGPLALMQRWLTGLLHGDPGVSWISGRPILGGMLQATGVSLTLMALALLCALTVALLLSAPVLRAGLQGRIVRSSGVLAVLFTALPEFLLASLLLIVGAVWLGLLPPYGWNGLRYAVLPALALGLPAGGYLGRIFSDALTSAFSEAWVLAWRVAGVSRAAIALAVMKRALPGILPLAALVVVSLTGGAIAVEKVFAIPGLGRATLGAAMAQDLPTLQFGILLLLSLAAAASLTAGVLRRLLVGRALSGHGMPAPREEQVRRSSSAAWLPLPCLALLALLLLAGLPRDPLSSQFLRLQPPALSLPFGADAMGRDLLARVAHGTLSTCLLAVAVSFICLLFGLLAGSFPRLFSGPIEVANALPPVIAGMLVVATLGPGAEGAMIAVAAVSWAPLAAHAAALIEEINARPYMRMLPVIGVGRRRATLCYVLPALAGPLLRHTMLRVPGIALALASLGFLGLGAAPPAPEWGRILAEGMPYMERAWWGLLAPAVALALLAVLAVSSASLATGSARRQ